MQHAVGAPLPPPHQSGNTAAGWPQQAHHPGRPPHAPAPYAPGGTALLAVKPSR
ncbi:Pro-rich N-terminal domain-containing protein, partial [Streptomyces somaliensis]|uniref:Pro-rich N-terminal domain-containing protein n=1 Tax=Streptomyces somaliensis TaxID=78355 RepID=UPI00263B9197